MMASLNAVLNSVPCNPHRTLACLYEYLHIILCKEFEVHTWVLKHMSGLKLWPKPMQGLHWQNVSFTNANYKKSIVNHFAKAIIANMLAGRLDSSCVHQPLLQRLPDQVS